MFDVPLEAEVSPSVSPSVKGEELEAAFVVKLASEMPLGETGFAASAGLPNVNPDPPKIKIKAIMNNNTKSNFQWPTNNAFLKAAVI